ncbi:MAG: hypothetical protein A2008_00085 [Candidatus Wallbacteria bacterium GWC2_49_35]|uniref:Uncharacterized protein n=1 Tax=Candidatus Wallbacteria bacterium GWC2_49_35 TaxID=1817813 RepID=A0A1F7WYV2_9BACT|nr:MAG: hypothetical protein A2008_00085 [Candidatus Wallbacteria bacterium GWC2_49_35]HBC73649.1 hypothetical protein [Candidatus Wallbacteria bacterium]
MIKKINAFLFITGLFLLCLAVYLHYQPPVRPKDAVSAQPTEYKAIAALCESATKTFAGFFSEADRVKFFSDIDTFIKSRGLKLVSLAHQNAPFSSFSILNINKTVFTINISGRYADVRNFLFLLESQPYLNSIDGLKLYPVQSSGPSSGETAAEIRYCLYSFVSLKKVKPGERSSMNDYKLSKARPDKTASIDKTPAVDIFRSSLQGGSSATAPPKTESLTAASKDTQSVKIISAPAEGPFAKKPAASDKLIYSGYYFDSKKGIKAFVEFDGRIDVVSAGASVGETYTVVRLDESSVVIANREEPFDTIEARLTGAVK